MKTIKYNLLALFIIGFGFNIYAQDTMYVVHNNGEIARFAISDIDSVIFYSPLSSLKEGLLLHLPFNGNAKDSSIYGNHGFALGAILAKDRHGLENHAYYFDGVDDFVEVAHDTSLYVYNEFSISVWINPLSFNRMGSRIVDKSIGSSYGLNLDTYDKNFEGRRIRLQAANSGLYMSETPLDTATWYHIVTTFKDGYNAIYINGQLDFEATGPITYLKNADTPLRIGFDTGVRVGPDYDDGFHGYIDDVRLYNRVLTEDEIQRLFQE